jgi:hypothetical protein
MPDETALRAKAREAIHTGKLPSRRPDRRVMNDLFRTFLDGVSTRGGFCLGCLSEMYSESALTVIRYLNEIGISSRRGTCVNCDERRETFRSDLSSDRIVN